MTPVDLRWLEKYVNFSELVVSPLGDNIATVVEDQEGQSFIWVNGKIIDEPFEKVNFLQFVSNGSLIASVQKDGLWTVWKDGVLWEEFFEYLWNLKSDNSGKKVLANVKVEGSYTVCVDGTSWSNSFYDARDLFVSPTGSKVATYVRLENYPVLEIFNFAKGMWSLAINDSYWDRRFLAVFGCDFSPQESKVAVAVRLPDRSFTIAVDGLLWDKTFYQVWEPRFLDENQVVAPVKTDKGWELYCNGSSFWGRPFAQLWNLKVFPEKKRVAAVVALELGKWTLAVDEKVWRITFGQCVLAPHFSPDGERVAAVVRDQDKWGLAVDGECWDIVWEKIGDPVFNPQGSKIAVKAEKDNSYYLVVDNKVLEGPYSYLWDPVFLEEDKVLVRGIKNKVYFTKEVKV
ncbi:hypothetical protein F1847_07885 [Thermodesulfobacterium sp. TA1]|uniref:hypothetical protein n=1 Tax=Thermodesulfobacterium sp. TA1 TaxID=2234087 RepID=UPI001231B2D9|nr:hypothetical protein [Thermodesulfobacterium sp. TA1]QER42661.1 hypothetical protein F1847_07885 [Thermodesulfobacterium sp. TA1]